MNGVITIVFSVVALVLLVACIFLWNRVSQMTKDSQKIGDANERARKIIDDALKAAEETKREKLLEAKEESLKTKNELEKEVRERRAEVQRSERRIQQKEENVEKRSETIERREQSLSAREENLNKNLLKWTENQLRLPDWLMRGRLS